MNLKISHLFIFLVFLFSTITLFAEDDFTVEGIMYESKNPSQSIVSIDGELYSQGDQVRGYEIIEIQFNRVVVKDEAGKVSEREVEGKKVVDEVEPVFLTDESIELEDLREPEKKIQLIDRLKQLWVQYDLGAIFRVVNEMKVLADLRKLYTQANIAMVEGDGQVMGLEEMISQGIADRAYRENPNGYSFRVNHGQKGPMVFADPFDDAQALYFMIDDEGRMRMERGKSATIYSPLYKSPLDFKKLFTKQNAPSDLKIDLT